MIFGLFASLFGCSEDPSKYGDWQSFRLHRTSSVKTDAYHFSITQAEDGTLTAAGFCYDDETEYRVEEEIYLSGSAWVALFELKPETLPTQKPKKSFGTVMDGAQDTASVTHTDGTERSVALTPEQRAEIVGVLTEELKSAVQSASHGEWDKLWLSYTNDNYSEWYNFEVKQNAVGDWIAVGYCSDDEYNRYESEEGIVLDAETVEAIRALKLERYPAVGKPDPEFEDGILLDGSSGGLTLGFADGYTEEKSGGDSAIAELLKKEFAAKADRQ
ncbi:MAG: hypothetical protein IKI93_01580 [Clostridia bacterium]|nr:hypothetical protein [Clostridia bacterium]